MSWEEIIKRKPTELQREFNRIIDELLQGMKEGSLTVEEAKELYGKISDLADRSKSLANFLFRSEEGREIHMEVYRIYEDNTPIEESY